MDFKEKIRGIASRASSMFDKLQTEEATKNALIMPLISALGYEVFNPSIVVPEYTADAGAKKGEKVDYAIMRDGKPIILFECKHSHSQLKDSYRAQLSRYFTWTEARIGVLTNGIEYRLYTDLDKQNLMDEKPFLSFDLLSIHDKEIEELEKLSNEIFDVISIVSSAEELKYSNEIKKILEHELDSPTDGFLKYIIPQIYKGAITQKVKERFSGVVKDALNAFIRGKVKNRLESALSSETTDISDSNKTEMDAQVSQSDDGSSEASNKSDRNSKIVTTSVEIEGYHVVKSILCDVADLSKVIARDTQSYFGILYENNNRKPICRLLFNNEDRLRIVIFSEGKVEEKFDLDNVYQIRDYSDKLVASVQQYMSVASDNDNDSNQRPPA